MFLKVDVLNSVEFVFNGISLMGCVYLEKVNNKKFLFFLGNWYRKRRKQFNLFKFCIYF